MKLPFVSRARYDLAVLIGTQSRNDLLALRNRTEQDRADFNALLDKYHSLRQQGHEPTVTHEAPLIETPPAILMRAIREVSPVPDRAYQLNYEYAMSLKDEWTSEAAMRRAAAKIRQGSGPANESEG